MSKIWGPICVNRLQMYKLLENEKHTISYKILRKSFFSAVPRRSNRHLLLIIIILLLLCLTGQVVVVAFTTLS